MTAPPWTLADWQTAPANRWTFHHLREVVPTAQVFRGDDGRRPLPRGPGLDLDDVPVALTSGGTTVAAILAPSSTDGFLVLHRGHVVIERYPAGMAAHQTHVLMSVSKSIVGCLVGILADRGALAVLTAPEPALARNYDYSPDLFECVVYSSAFTGRRVNGTSDCLWGLLDGISDAGLAMSLAFGGRRGAGEGFAIPLVVRYLLETADTADDAIRRLHGLPVNMTYNLTMVDAQAPRRPCS